MFKEIFAFVFLMRLLFFILNFNEFVPNFYSTFILVVIL